MPDNVTNLPRCQATKADGSSCERIVGAGQQYCYSHDKARARERSVNASKAAKSKPAAELAALRAQVRGYMDAVESGKLDKGKGAVLAQLAGVAGRLYEAEARIRELLEVRVPEFTQLQGEVRELRELLDEREAREKRGGLSWAG